LGRVMVHELYHILASTQQHTRTGITKALQTPVDLIKSTVQIDRQAILFLRQRLRIELPGGPLRADRQLASPRTVF